MDLRSLTPKPTAHFIATMNSKGFDPAVVIATIKAPVECYPSGKRYPGQWRLTGNGVCIVTRPEGDDLVLITCYVDREVTPVRPDQMNTPQGRRFAAHGRGA